MFDSLGLVPELVAAARVFGLEQPTPIQSAAIPCILRGSDLLATARTGSGKTAAFALPCLQGLLALPRAASGASRVTRLLVLVPTRELAAQTAEVMRRLTPVASGLKLAVVFGGVAINPQMMQLRGGADVVVATPGRLLDLVDKNALKLSGVLALVLDEADRLLDPGFADETQRVLALLPARRQSLMFSATFPEAVAALANRIMHEPERIDIADDERDRAVILQRAIAVDSDRRTQLLRHLIESWPNDRVLVFVATRYGCDRLVAKLQKAGIWAHAFHGELSQATRAQALHEFRQERWQVLVTTDLAARGIDIEQLPAVVNFDLPRSATDYQHRIGRTGRAGVSGLAISFVPAASELQFRLIEKRQGMSLPRERITGFEPLVQWEPVQQALPGAGGIKGRRPSKKDKLRASRELPG